jgi:hypothetical protein
VVVSNAMPSSRRLPVSGVFVSARVGKLAVSGQSKRRVRISLDGAEDDGWYGQAARYRPSRPATSALPSAGTP